VQIDRPLDQLANLFLRLPSRDTPRQIGHISPPRRRSFFVDDEELHASIVARSAILMEEEHAMPKIDTPTSIDWTKCELIECVPGKVSGRPVVRGTRILPDAIVGSYDLSETIEELHRGFPTLTIAQIKGLIEFAHAQREHPL
jgi:uncharacterized protein (DUF433 family)